MLMTAFDAVSFRPLQWPGQPYAGALHITFIRGRRETAYMLSPAILFFDPIIMRLKVPAQSGPGSPLAELTVPL